MLNTGCMNSGLHSVVQGLCELPKQLRWSYLPPLMVYLAAGVSGLTAIVGTFFYQRLFEFICCIFSQPWLLGWLAMGVKNAAWTSGRFDLEL